MSTKTKYTITSFKDTSVSTNWYWTITNNISGDVEVFPAITTKVTLQVQSASDYNFIFNKNKLDQFECNIIDIFHIKSSAPAYNNSVADFASLLNLINT